MSTIRECDRDMWQVIRDLDTEKECEHSEGAVMLARGMRDRIVDLYLQAYLYGDQAAGAA
jgi:hypothetical protein